MFGCIDTERFRLERAAAYRAGARRRARIEYFDGARPVGARRPTGVPAVWPEGRPGAVSGDGGVGGARGVAVWASSALCTRAVDECTCMNITCPCIYYARTGRRRYW